MIHGGQIIGLEHHLTDVYICSLPYLEVIFFKTKYINSILAVIYLNKLHLNKQNIYLSMLFLYYILN